MVSSSDARELHQHGLRRTPQGVRPLSPGGSDPLLDTHKQSGARENDAVREEAADRLRDHERTMDRYSRGHARALAQAKYLRSIEGAGRYQSDLLTKTATKLETCAQLLEFRAYFTEDTIKLTAARLCEQYKLCPLCAARRAGRGVRRYAARVAHVMSEAPTLKPYLVTLTMRNQDNLDAVFERFMDCKSRLVQRRRDAVKIPPRTHSVTMHWDGFVGSLEIKRGRNSDAWHPHVHLVVLSREDLATEDRQEQLSAEWHAITGDSFIVDARPFQHPDDPARDLVEVLKYPMKFQGLSLADAWHAHDLTRGRRFLFSGGSLWGVKIDLVDEALADDLPYVELLYEYDEHVGTYAEPVDQAEKLQAAMGGAG